LEVLDTINEEYGKYGLLEHISLQNRYFLVVEAIGFIVVVLKCNWPYEYLDLAPTPEARSLVVVFETNLLAHHHKYVVDVPLLHDLKCL
jgi:hypothetical protein